MDPILTPEIDSSILRMAVDQSPSSILVTDAMGRIEFVNPRFCELTGYAPEELLGQTPGILKSGRTSTEEYSRLWTTLRSGRPWSGVFCNRKKNGDLYWEAARILPVPSSDGTIGHYLGIKEDITELKRLEEELSHLDKSDWLGRLAGGIAHDFNNLLTSILGFGAPVQKALHGTRMGEDLVRVLSAAERATELAHNLYVLANRVPPQPRWLDLNNELQSMRPLLRHLLSPKVRFEFRPGELTKEAFLDPVELQRIVINLLTCRLDASAACRTIVVSTSRRTVDSGQAAAHSRTGPGDFLCIEIQDPVSGEQANDSTRDSDAGMPAAIRILRDNAGFLSVDESAPPAIAIRAFLPAGVAAPSAGQSPPGGDPGMADKSVLLVEDDEHVAAWLRRVLVSAGYQVMHAGSAEQAFEVLGDGSAFPSIVITDVSLPGMNGVAMVESLRDVSPEIKVIYITGSTLPDNLPPSTPMLQKPFSPDAILERLSALDHHFGASILVVDDDDGIRELIRVTLERAGYSVVGLADGIGVEDELAARHYDLVITDLVMPQREGLEVIQAARRLHPDLPVVATSGAFGGYFLDVARKLGASEILLKPLHPDHLLSCVRKVLSAPRPGVPPCR